MDRDHPPTGTLVTVKTKHLAVPAEAIWEHLVGTGRRDWYYRLTPDGTFEPGARVHWLDTRGEPAEESEVLELAAPLLLRLRTRFVFAPPFAAAPAHEVTWELSPEQDGTRVTLSWDGSGPALGLLESEGGAILDGLALAVDPVARAALERLPEIGPLEIRDLTVKTLAAYQRFFDEEAFRDYPAWQSCYCIEPLWDGTDDESAPRTAADNRQEMSELVSAGRVTALLAFDGERPVAWCHYGESTALAGLTSAICTTRSGSGADRGSRRGAVGLPLELEDIGVARSHHVNRLGEDGVGRPGAGAPARLLPGHHRVGATVVGYEHPEVLVVTGVGGEEVSVGAQEGVGHIRPAHA